MATISKFGPLAHLRSEPNAHILRYRNGRLVEQGAGLSFWFNPLTAAVAQVPVEDQVATFVLKERGSDFQELHVQVATTWRVASPEKAAGRFNFSISPQSGTWLEPPLERIAGEISNRAQPHARARLAAMAVVDAVRGGAEAVQVAVLAALRGDGELQEMGIAVVGVQVVRVATSAEVEKALQTPTREAIQQKADEATFARRALAVEKERAIKENELATEIELERRHEDLLRQQGANKLLQIKSEAEAERARVEAEVERQTLAAEGYAKQIARKAEGDAVARRTVHAAEAEYEERRVAMLAAAPSYVAFAMAVQRAADKVQTIQHLNVTPDLLGTAFEKFLQDQADR